MKHSLICILCHRQFFPNILLFKLLMCMATNLLLQSPLYMKQIMFKLHIVKFVIKYKDICIFMLYLQYYSFKGGNLRNIYNL